MKLEEAVPERERKGKKWEKLLRELDPYFGVRVFHEGNFTIAVLTDDVGGGIAVGAAKRNPADDPYVQERGDKLAIIRAWRRYARRGWE